jgi:hypothetical protein
MVGWMGTVISGIGRWQEDLEARQGQGGEAKPRRGPRKTTEIARLFICPSTDLVLTCYSARYMSIFHSWQHFC